MLPHPQEMDHLSGVGGGGVLDRQKDSVVLGTYESSAFILSLRDADEFSTIHSFGYHCIPHIGECRGEERERGGGGEGERG